MRPALRKLALTVHVTSSVGWIGAVACFLALAVTGLTSADPQLVRGVYLATEVITWCIIVPLSLATLLTGLIQSLGTSWGLFRHYWVIAKLVLTVIATALLLLHTGPIDRVASAASTGTLDGAHHLRVQLVGDAIAAIVVLLGATALSIYKPWGPTAYGRRRESEPAEDQPARWYLIPLVVVLVLGFLGLHLVGAGLHGH